MARVEMRAVGVRELASIVDGLPMEGNTVAEVLDQLARKLGPESKDALFNEQGGIDYSIQILLNGETWVERDKLEAYPLQDGDKVMILGVMSGG